MILVNPSLKQTPFPPDQVLFEIKRLSDHAMLTSSSDGFLNVFDLNQQKVVERICCSEGRINNFKISCKDPSLVYTCSNDCSIQCIDLRSPQKSPVRSLHSKKPLNSIDLRNNFLVSGSDFVSNECSVDLWDLRFNSIVGSNNELHTEDITCVEFLSDTTFCSSSIDGLTSICLVDTFACNGSEFVLNSGGSIAKTVGTSNNELNVFLSTEEYLKWDLHSMSKRVSFGSIKQYNQDCLIDIIEGSNSLLLFSGQYSGDFLLSTTDSSSIIPLISFVNGHSDCVRGVYMHDYNYGLIGSIGDDGAICFWKTSSN